MTGSYQRGDSTDVVLRHTTSRFGSFTAYCLANCPVRYCKYLPYPNSSHFTYTIYSNIMLKLDKVQKFISFFTWLSMIGKILPLFYFLRVPILPALMLKKIMLETKWYHISHSVVVYRKPFDRFDNMQNKE